MSILTTTRNYATGSVLFKADLDAFLDDIEEFLNITKITDGNIQDQGISANLKLADASITTSKINNSAITTAKILNSEVKTININDLAVTTAKLKETPNDISTNGYTIYTDAGTVTTSKLASNSITAVKIGSNSVSLKNTAANNMILNTSTFNANITQVSGLNTAVVTSTPITTTGRPLLLGFQKGSISFQFGDSDSIANNESGVSMAYVSMYRDGVLFAKSAIGNSRVNEGLSYSYPLTALKAFDTPAAGTYSYTVQIQSIGDGRSFLTANIPASSFYILEL